MWHNRITENIQQTNSKPEEAEEKTGKRQAPSGGKRHRPGIATSKETARTNGNLRPQGKRKRQEGSMTKKKMITEILEDMYKRSGEKKKDVDKRFKGFLNSLPKADVETIYKNRMNRKHELFIV